MRVRLPWRKEKGNSRRSPLKGRGKRKGSLNGGVIKRGPGRVRVSGVCLGAVKKESGKGKGGRLANCGENGTRGRGRDTAKPGD